jgi:hypothetical protein
MNNKNELVTFFNGRKDTFCSALVNYSSSSTEYVCIYVYHYKMAIFATHGIDIMF